MSKTQRTSPDTETQYRVADDTTTPDSDPHLLGTNMTHTLCGEPIIDPQVIGGTTETDKIPDTETAHTSDICTQCAQQAHNHTTQNQPK